MKIFLVGGAVRDKILGLEIKDEDFVVVGSEPKDLLDKGFSQVGKDFPVFLHPQTKDEYALARKEIKTGSGYHGFEFDCSKDVSIEEDLFRRDLTINAMALDGENLIDPFSGKKDLENKVLRHVSDHFKEDPVRILRIARFKARYNSLGFEIAEETKNLMKSMVKNGEVHNLVPERVVLEMEKAFKEEKPSVFFEVLRECGALKVLFPHLDKMYGVPQRADYHPEIDCGIHAMMVLDQGRRISDGNFDFMYACLTHDLGKGITPQDVLPQHIMHEKNGIPLVEQMSEQYKVPSRAKKLAMLNCENHLYVHKAFELKPKKIYDLFKKFDAFRNQDLFIDFITACKADARGRTGYENVPYEQRDYLLHILEYVHKQKSKNKNIAKQLNELAKKGLIESNVVGSKIQDRIKQKTLEDIQNGIYLYEKNITPLIENVKDDLINIKNIENEKIFLLFSKLKVSKNSEVISFVMDKIGFKDENILKIAEEFSSVSGEKYVNMGIKGVDIAKEIKKEKERIINKLKII